MTITTMRSDLFPSISFLFSFRCGRNGVCLSRYFVGDDWFHIPPLLGMQMDAYRSLLLYCLFFFPVP